MDKIPFNVYDFFAYLSAGAVVIAVGDLIFGFHLASLHEIAPVLAVELIVLAYVLGHIVAHFSSFFFEHLIIGRVLGRPTGILLREPPRLKLLRFLFPNYFRPLPVATVDRVRVVANGRGCSAAGEALFLHAYGALTGSSDKVQARLDDFRNQYGFARNMSFAFLVAALALAVAHQHNRSIDARWTACALLISLALFYRYLKFFRQFSYDLLLRYAESGQEDSNKS